MNLKNFLVSCHVINMFSNKCVCLVVYALLLSILGSKVGYAHGQRFMLIDLHHPYALNSDSAADQVLEADLKKISTIVSDCKKDHPGSSNVAKTARLVCIASKINDNSIGFGPGAWSDFKSFIICAVMHADPSLPYAWVADTCWGPEKENGEWKNLDGPYGPCDPRCGAENTGEECCDIGFVEDLGNGEGWIAAKQHLQTCYAKHLIQ